MYDATVEGLRAAFDDWSKALNAADLDTFYSFFAEDAEILDEDYPWRMDKADFQDHIAFHTGVWESFAWIGRPLVTSATPAANVTTFTYNATHGLLTIQDPRGIQPIRNEYDNNGRLIRHTDAYGHTIDYTHDLNNRQEIVKDRLGNLTVNEYDDRGNVVRVTDARGGVTTRSYDARNNVLTETNPNGASTRSALLALSSPLPQSCLKSES